MGRGLTRELGDLPVSDLTKLAEWLVSLDDPNSPDRPSVNLQRIIERARVALEAERASSSPAYRLVVSPQWLRIIRHHVEGYGWRLVDVSVVLEGDDLPTYVIWPKEENERATAPDPE